MRYFHITSAAFLLGLFSFTAYSSADADAAKKDLEQAKTEIGSNDLNAANNDIQLAEAELDGVADAAKAPILKDIAALKKTLADTKNAGAKEEAVKKIDSMINEAKGSLDNKSGFDESDQAITDYLSKPEIKTALGDDAVAKYLKQLAVYRKVATNNAYTRNLDQVKGLLETAQKDWPDKLKEIQTAQSPEGAQQVGDDFQRDLDRIQTFVKDFPKDKPEAVALVDQFNKLQSALKAEMFKAQAGETYNRLKRYWDSYADDWAGWDKETTGPSFNDMLHNQGDTISAFNAPKTVALISRANNYLDTEMQDEVVRALSTSDPKLKGLFDDIRAQRQAGWTKLAKFATAVLDQASKATLNKESRDLLETIANDNLRLALEGSDQLKPLQQRALKLVGAFDQKAIGDAAAQGKLYTALVDQANKAWPTMVQKASASEGLDAVAAMQKIDNFKGKTIVLKNVKNRMGWEYSPDGGYEFALTIDSVPVAGKFDPAVRKAFNAITARTGKDFSDDQYDVIATVEGLGPIIQIARSEGTIQTTGGEKIANVTASRLETVQGVRLKIIGLHVGPVAATTDGAVDEKGNISQ